MKSPKKPGARSVGWGWPAAVVVVLHLGVAAIPLHFSQAHSEENPPIRLTLTAAEMPEPAPVEEVEVVEEVVVPEPVVAREPRTVQKEPKVAVVEREIPPVVKPPPVEEVVEPVEEVLEEVEGEQKFDLAKVAPIVAPEPRPAPPSPPPVEAEPVDWQHYGRTVMSSVRAELRYPRMALRRGLEGTATVRIVIARDGNLVRAPEIVDSTSHRNLDREVLRMVEAAAPFEAFPGHADDEEQEFVIPVRFRIQS